MARVCNNNLEMIRDSVHCAYKHRGVEQLVARRAHNPKVAGSSPVPTTKQKPVLIRGTGFSRFPRWGSRSSWFPPAFLPARFFPFIITSLIIALFLVPGSLIQWERAEAGEQLLSGIDSLEVTGCSDLKGLRVGLITNAAARTKSGEQGYRMMLRQGVLLRYLLSPEHGFALDVEAGEKAGGAVLSGSLPVHSLYGASRRPDPSLLREVDILVFDLQDVGVRCYTYISTMKYAMEACSEAGISFMVLDRPNPISPLGRGGFMLEPASTSFVGSLDVPFLHAMTVGEIALFIKKRYCPDLSLRVVKMSGWDRGRFGDQFSGYSFRSPSPNIRSVEGAILYPATVFLEATNVSEGRGTGHPFMQFGAPFIDGEQLALRLNLYALPGVRFKAVRFVPTSSKFKGEECRGVRLQVTDRDVFDPFMTASVILSLLHNRYPQEFGIDRHRTFFDRLAGTPRFREMITSGMTPRDIVAESRREAEGFRPLLLYP